MQDEVKKEESEQNEVDGTKKRVDSTGKMIGLLTISADDVVNETDGRVNC